MYQSKLLHEVQCLFQDLEEKNCEIERLKAALEAQEPQPESPMQTMEDENQILQIEEAACLYTLTVNTYLTSRVLQLQLSTEWDPTTWWDDRFINEGHLCKFLDWLMLADPIKDRISDWAIQKKV